jgi:hypothetical protein
MSSGVPVDTYKLNVNMALRDSNFTGSYGLEYEFAAPSWRNGQEAGHRPLQRVVLRGLHKGPSTNNKILVWAALPCHWSHLAQLGLSLSRGAKCCVIDQGADEFFVSTVIQAQLNVPRCSRLISTSRGSCACVRHAQ